MWVYTKTDESDVGSIPIGKPVTFKVDAFPKETFQGVVKQVRMNPTMVQSVVTYDTIIEFSNPHLKLLPGMTAYVAIPLASVQNVLKIPNTALRYKPPYAPDEILAIYKQFGIDGAERAQASSDTVNAASLPQSELVIVTGASHLALLDKPDAVNDGLVRLVKRAIPGKMALRYRHFRERFRRRG